MMEIPAGNTCKDCRFFQNGYEDGSPTCGAFEDVKMRDYDGAHGFKDRYWGIDLSFYDSEGRGYARAAQCLSAYPNGAVVTITPKEQFDVGFIPHGDSVIDPKTGVKTYDNVELVEVSIIKPK